MRLPTFLIIGAAKSGTTSLYQYLGQHPEVFISPVKEPHFFAFSDASPEGRGPGDGERAAAWIRQPAAYGALFAGVTGERAIGEASQSYLYHPAAAERIHRLIPRARLIVVLRNPVDRAYSQYLQQVREGWETQSFPDALALEDARIRDHWGFSWHYAHRGDYHRQLSRYLRVFAREQLHVHLYEDLDRDPRGVVQATFRFLEVDPSFTPDVSRRYNVSGVPRSRRVQRWLRRPDTVTALLKRHLPAPLRRRLADAVQRRNLVRPPVADELRRELAGRFREDVLRLQDMIGRDLSAWL